MYVPEFMYECHVCAVPTEVRKGQQILWNWSHRRL